MPRKLDLIGQEFGKLTVIKRVENNKRGATMWECECECGNKTVVEGSELKRGNNKSCGCIKKSSLIGRKFGRLTVIKENGRNKYMGIIWLCKCDCGNEKKCKFI